MESNLQRLCTFHILHMYKYILHICNKDSPDWNTVLAGARWNNWHPLLSKTSLWRLDQLSCSDTISWLELSWDGPVQTTATFQYGFVSSQIFGLYWVLKQRPLARPMVHSHAPLMVPFPELGSRFSDFGVFMNSVFLLTKNPPCMLKLVMVCTMVCTIYWC